MYDTEMFLRESYSVERLRFSNWFWEIEENVRTTYVRMYVLSVRFYPLLWRGEAMF